MGLEGLRIVTISLSLHSFKMKGTKAAKVDHKERRAPQNMVSLPVPLTGVVNYLNLDRFKPRNLET